MLKFEEAVTILNELACAKSPCQSNLFKRATPEMLTSVAGFSSILHLFHAVFFFFFTLDSTLDLLTSSQLLGEVQFHSWGCQGTKFNFLMGQVANNFRSLQCISFCSSKLLFKQHFECEFTPIGCDL